MTTMSNEQYRNTAIFRALPRSIECDINRQWRHTVVNNSRNKNTATVKKNFLLELELTQQINNSQALVNSTKTTMPPLGASGAADGGQLEEKIDLSEETEAKLKQSASLVQGGQLREALALLAALEKRCRVGNDTASLVKVVEASIQYCRDVGDEEALLSTLQTLATRRSQKTQAVKALESKAIPWCLKSQYEPIDVANAAQKDFRDKLVVALRDITDGKIFLETERARLTRALAAIKVSVLL